MQFRGVLTTHSSHTNKASEAGQDSSTVRLALNDYVMLTKPRIISLLLITTLVPMYLAANTPPSGWLILWTLIGGALAAGGQSYGLTSAERDGHRRRRRLMR